MLWVPMNLAEPRLDEVRWIGLPSNRGDRIPMQIETQAELSTGAGCQR